MSRGAKLRPDLVLVEQTYRGEQSYIVKDPTIPQVFPVSSRRDHGHADARRRAHPRRSRGSPRRGRNQGFACREWRHLPRNWAAWGSASAPWGSARCFRWNGFEPSGSGGCSKSVFQGRSAADPLVGGRPRQAVRPVAASAPLLLHPHLSGDFGRAIRGISAGAGPQMGRVLPGTGRSLHPQHRLGFPGGSVADRHCHHRHPRAGSRPDLQVLRRAGARDRCDADLLRAGFLLQRERRLDVPRASRPACG